MEITIFVLVDAHDRRNMLRSHRRVLRDATDHLSEARFVELFRFSKDSANFKFGRNKSLYEMWHKKHFYPQSSKNDSHIALLCYGIFLEGYWTRFCVLNEQIHDMPHSEGCYLHNSK